MSINKAVENFLEEYYFTLSDKEKIDFENKGYDTWSLGYDEQSSNRLVNLVFKNQKRAVSTLFSKKDKIPAVDSYGILLDYQGTPKCLVKYTRFTTKPFSEIGTDFVQEDGFQDTDEWSEEHRNIFKKEDSRFNNDSLVLCGNFKLVFKYSD